MTSKDKTGTEQWIDAHSKGKGDAEDLRKLWNATGNYKNTYKPDVEEGLLKLNSRIKSEEVRPRQEAIVTSMSRYNWLLRIAAAVVVLVVSVLAFKHLFNPSNNLETIASKEGATSTIRLNDGSSVTLNEKSNLAFPERFKSDERRVRLEGEGYFEIAPDATRPFLIETELAEIQVLGTSFNVRSYSGEELLDVYVTSGKVSVTIKESGQKILLVPGERLFFEKNETVPVKSLDKSGNALAWKAGVVKFRDASFDEIFKSVERSFGVTIEVKDPAILNCTHTISIPLDMAKLREAFKALEKAYPIRISEPSPKQFVVSGKCH